MKKQSNSGFTLIELIIVIVILGILAVSAAPRFLNLTSDAHTAVFNGTLGSFRAGIDLAHNKWRVSGNSGAVENLVDTLDFNSIGFPAGIDGGDQVGSEQDCVDVFNSVMESDLVLAIPVGDGAGIKNLAASVDIAVTNNANICYYTFVSESKAVGFEAPQFRYLYTTGDVTVDSFTLN